MNAMLGLVESAHNATRYRACGRGHVESYFLRANDPERPRALWLKATILEPHEGAAVSECWLIWFDGEKSTTFAHRVTQPYVRRQFESGEGDEVAIELGTARFHLGVGGTAQGALEREGTRAAWDLHFARAAGGLGAPLSLYPWRLLRQGPFPKFKLSTPFPVLDFGGTLQVGNERVDLSGWTGMQGHNWGRTYAAEYAWGQCLFPASADAPAAMLEGFTARIELAGRITPPFSALVVRYGEATYTFTRLLDFWRQDAETASWRWRARLLGPDGEAEVFMNAEQRPMVCLGYVNPDGAVRYCFNSKLAHTRVHLRPRDGAPFELESAHGGALELLRQRQHPDFANVI